MFEPSEISRLRQEVGRYAKAFDADLISAVDAVVVLGEASRIEKMAATLVSLAAARASDTDVLEREGDLSPAHGLARRTGTTVTKASDALRTAKRLRAQPALEAAARSGDVSPEQATPSPMPLRPTPPPRPGWWRRRSRRRWRSDATSASRPRQPPTATPRSATGASMPPAMPASGPAPTGQGRSSTAPPGTRWPSCGPSSVPSPTRRSIGPGWPASTSRRRLTRPTACWPWPERRQPAVGRRRPPATDQERAPRASPPTTRPVRREAPRSPTDTDDEQCRRCGPRRCGPRRCAPRRGGPRAGQRSAPNAPRPRRRGSSRAGDTGRAKRDGAEGCSATGAGPVAARQDRGAGRPAGAPARLGG